MSSPPQPTPTRRRTFEYSHQPEQGLQEWASRIKSIQAEVDLDEQAEQQRLEEEIVASRIARAQRRAKQGSRRLSDIATSVPPDPEPMKTPESPTKPSTIFGARAALLSPSTPGKGDPDTIPDSPTKSAFGSARTMTTNSSSSAKQNAPMSLAAFMGARGTGPRLNKPAPQVDTHDPTLFDQNTRRTGPSATANAFQSGGRVTKWGQGVALPGLGAPPRQPSPTDKPRSPRFASPEEQLVAPQHTRQRTSSNPEKPRSPFEGSSPETKSELTRSKTTGRTRGKSTSSPNSPPKVQGSSAFSTPTRNGPFKSHTTPTQGSSPTPGLARPIQPTPPAQDPNKLPLVSAASPAFRSTVQASAKELSPSLTRLQGRGFVGNRIRQADGSASPPSSLGISTNQFGEREKPKRGGVGNVQGRWHAAIQGQQSSSPLAASPVEVPWKRRSLKEPVPAPGDSKIAGIIKHMTGAQQPSPAVSSGSQRESPSFDEFGRKASPIMSKATPVPASASSPFKPVPRFEETKSGIQPKPLNHLTRDRARKPKKGVQVKGVWDAPEPVSTTPVATPPQDNRPPSPFKRLRPATSQPSMRPPSPIKESSLQRQGTLPRAQASPRAAANPSHPSPTRKPAQPFPTAPRPESPTKESNISRAKDLWGERAPIGVKSQNGGQRGPSPGPVPRGPNLVGKRALPGMVSAPQPQQRVQPQPFSGRPESPTKPSTPKPVSPVSPPRHVGPPPSPGRNKSRTTVMELAQAMSEKQGEPSEELKMPPSPRSVPAAPRERRRSSYDRYSVVTMPPLKEEKTPTPTPAGTLSKSQELGVPTAEPVLVSTSPKTSPRISPKPSPRLSPKALSPRPSPKAQPPSLPVEKVDGVFRIDQNMAPIPPFNLQQAINSNPYNFTFPSNFRRISTDVFSLSNDRATLVTSNPCLVYDTELVAVVQRVRNETNGLVLSKVWGWCGKKAQPGGKEEGKLVELAKQYGTSVVAAFQGAESQELVDAVGGHWITRQGFRAHWTPENTTMHCTRRLGDAIFIDEVDFHVSNLCSAYSYCVTALDAVYVWHGRGTTQSEREAASAYARTIAGPEKEADAFEEGKEDPMFFMLLGDHKWANADYWKYRGPLGKIAYRPRMFIIDARDKKQPVSCHIPSVNKVTPDTILVLDNMLEMMVLIGAEARARRTDILLAVHIAISIATSVENKRPFVPPVHLVVLPSRLPLEVKAGFFRFVSDELVNPTGVPSHMHLLTLSEASDELSATTLPMSKLRDPTFLPLGIHPSLLN